MTPKLKFDHLDAMKAHEEWGCNCGPAALAAILGLDLSQIRPHVEKVGFRQKRYMNPTMMRQALTLAGGRLTMEWSGGAKHQREGAFPEHGLARIQWTGPWTAPMTNKKWAYGYTHWIAAWKIPPSKTEILVFDVNSGITSVAEWEKLTVPAILAEISRADGGWLVTHGWEVGKNVLALRS